MVLLLDTESGIEITGLAQGPGMNLQREIQDWASLERFAPKAGFPSHHLVIRPDHAEHPTIAKGIDTVDRLRACFDAAMSKSVGRQVFVENDLRAHCNPTRQSMIVKAAQDLVDRLNSFCPRCTSPDFWIKGFVKGKPCRWCREPTAEVMAERWGCSHCSYSEVRHRDGGVFADPAHCQYCNP
jgi:ribosomal protein S27AE